MKVTFRTKKEILTTFTFLSPLTLTEILENSRVLIWMTAQNLKFKEVLNFNNDEAELLVDPKNVPTKVARTTESAEAHLLG